MAIRVNPLEGSIFKKMVLFALPVMAIALLQSLFSSMDMVIIGRYGSENGLAAIGVNASLINLIIGGITGLSIGISAVFGKLFGEKREDQISKIHQSIPLSALLIGLAVVLLCIPFGKVFLRLIDCPDTLLNLAYEYFLVYMLSAPFLLLFSFESAVLEAYGDSFHPLLIGIFLLF